MSADRNRSTVLSVFWCGFFTLFAAAVTLISLTAALNPLGLPRWLLPLAIPMFVVQVAIILVSLSLRALADDLVEALVITVMLTVATAPCFIAVAAPQLELPSLWFYISLLLWLGIGLVSVYRSDAGAWAQLLTWLGTASTMTSALCAIGLYAPIAFAAQPLRDARNLHMLLDIRLTLGIGFLALCLLTATVRAFRFDLGAIPALRLLRVRPIAPRHTILAPLTNPLIIVFNGAVFVVTQALNVLIGLVVTLILRVLRTGRELASLLWQLAFQKNAVMDLLRALMAMAVTFGVIVAALELAPSVQGYLQASGRVSNAELPMVGALALIVLIGSSVITLLNDGRATEVPRILFGASLIAVLLVLSGGVVYVVAATDLIALPGFKTPGPVTVATGTLILLGVTAASIMGVVEQRNAAASNQPPSAAGQSP